MGNTETGPLAIGRHPLTIASTVAVADSRSTVFVPDDVGEAMLRNQRFLENVARETVVYGVNTGFGPMAGHRIEPGDQIDLQRNLVRSHAVGQGDPLPDRFVRAAMLARLGSLCQARSGVAPGVAKALAAMINSGVHPIVPERGSVGASGDLVQLAHIALGLMGEGSARLNGEAPRPAAEALAAKNLAPFKITGREGLALINGTSAMAGIAACAASDARRAVNLSILLSAWLHEIAGASPEHLAAPIHAARPHPGQESVARKIREILEKSERAGTAAGRSARSEATRDYREVQHGYSIRCVPQIIGPVLEATERASATIEIELNASTDNPITVTGEGVFHGGNFHGDYVAAAADTLKLFLAKLGMLAERQIAFLFDPKENRALPPFLNLGKLGVDLGLQGLQFVATSTAAMGQTLAFPASLHSIPTNNGNQDVVSMGADAALLAAKVTDGTSKILTIEAFALARATRILGVEAALCPKTRAAYRAIATIGFPDGDRFDAGTVSAIGRLIHSHPAFT